MADDTSSPETDPATEPASPAVERRWRPADDAPATGSSPDAPPHPDAGPEPAPDRPTSDGSAEPEAERPSPEDRPADTTAADEALPSAAAEPDTPGTSPSPEAPAPDDETGTAPQDPPPGSPADAPGRPGPADADSRPEADPARPGGTGADGGDADGAPPIPGPEAGEDRPPTDAGPPREASSDSSAPDDALPPDDAPEPAGGAPDEEEPGPGQEPDPDREAARAEGKRINEEAFADAESDSAWTDRLAERDDRPDAPRTRDPDRSDFYTDQRRGVRGAEQIEEEIQDFVYEVNDGSVGTDWTPEAVEARRTATMFAILVSKVAEDMSYERRPGDEFWDPRKIMRRQIDNRPLRHCKMDYTKRRLALLVDTSPSCRDEAAFYSKIASGAMLRDDIDIFLCPNGRIDARFDPEPMRFVDDDRGADWGLDGRTVLYFTDWDGADEIVTHSRACTLYWFDHCPPADYWESARDRYQRVRLRYRGRHFHCPGPDAFRRLARKIRP
jgi:hypothetical protein